MDAIKDKAQELGRVLGQTDEYKALAKARQRLSEDRDAVTAMNQLSELEREISASLQAGQEPSDEAKTAYESVFGELQASPVYQGIVAAQSNFDKILQRMNEEISRGIETGAQSRIILPH
ncbi:YlbF family regulator [soil metagenome]